MRIGAHGCDNLPQVSVYLNEDIYKELKLKAKEKERSMSRIMSDRLIEYLHGWPQGYFDVFGSLKDDSFEIPEDLPWEPK